MLNEYFDKSKEKELKTEHYASMFDYIEKKLERATLNFFPLEGKWYYSCYKRPDDLNKKNLPCHLYDNEWLVKMLKKDQNLKIDDERILDFIENSEFFKEAKKEYTQRIIKWQIEWMKQGGDNWLVPEGYGGDFTPIMKDYDKCFREGVLKTLTYIGINEEEVEEGLERNANIWRDIMMETAYFNEFEGLLADNVFLKPNHQERWLKYRNYEYYMNHKQSVDKYGSINDDMLISEEEVNELELFLGLKDKVKELKF